MKERNILCHVLLPYKMDLFNKSVDPCKRPKPAQHHIMFNNTSETRGGS